MAAKSWEAFVVENSDRVIAGSVENIKNRSKYNSKKVFLEGRWFDSEGEAYYYRDYLKLLVLAGEITDFEFQPEFEIHPAFTDENGKKHKAIRYRGDFQFVENGKIVVVDFKGVETRIFKDKRKMFLKRYPEIDFRVVKKERK